MPEDRLREASNAEGLRVAGAAVIRRRPGGRAEKVRISVLAAAEGMLRSGSFRSLEFADVARAAGVSYTTIWRAAKEFDVAFAQLRTAQFFQEVGPQDTGSLEKDLISWSQLLSERLKFEIIRSAESGSVKFCSLFFRAFDRKIREQLSVMLDNGRRREGNSPSVDDIVTGVIAPIVFDRLRTGVGDQSGFIQARVRGLLSGS